MASKQTKRERKELAKKQRLDQRRQQIRRQRMRKLTTIVSVVAAVSLITAFVLWKSASDRAAERKRNAAVITAASAVSCGGQVQSPPEEGRQHFQPPNKVKYAQNPPTSGNHYDSTGPLGVFPTQVPEEYYVHNLEHGHVGIWYTTALPADVKSALEKFTNANNTWVFMSPRASMPATLALTAWNKSLKCGSTLKDDPAGVSALAKAFYDRFHDKAPESAAGKPAS